MLVSALMVTVSIGVLVLGAELLVRGSVQVARRLGVSNLFIGLTIVGFGTSTPELSASVTAAWRGIDGIAVGNVVGSNVCNVALIVGAGALLRPLTFHFPTVRREVIAALIVGLVPFAALATGGVVTRWMGAAMVAALGVYLWLSWRVARRQSAEERAAAGELEEMLGGGGHPPAWRSVGLILAGLCSLIFGARLLVEHAVVLAQAMGVSELVIGLTVIAVGTSMPELITSIVAGIRRQSDLALGNVLGSNVFNVLAILGTAAVVRPQPLGLQVVAVDLPVSVLLVAALLPICASGSRVSRAEGALLLGAFVVYTAFQYALAPSLFGAA